MLARPDVLQRAEAVTVPREAFELLVRILEEMAQGHAVTIVPIHAELPPARGLTLNVSASGALLRGPRVVQITPFVGSGEVRETGRSV